MRFGFTWTLPVLLALAAGLAGCTPAVSVRPTGAGDIEQVKAGELALVLLQIKAAIDGKAVSPLDAIDSNRHIRIYLANLGKRNAPEPISVSSPSEASAAEGWQHMLLHPGIYYLLILPPGVEQNPPSVAFSVSSARFGRLTRYKFEPGRGAFWSPELTAFVFAGTPPQDFRELPGFWFEVPSGKPVVYIGTVSVACSSGRGLFGDLIDSCSDFNVTVDTTTAQRLAAATWQGLGTVDTEPLALYGKARDGMRLRERGPIDVVMQDSAPLGIVYTGAQMTSWGIIQGAPPVYNLAVTAVQATAQSIAQSNAEQRVMEAQPCMTQLARTLTAFDYASPFAAALAEAAHSNGADFDLDNERGLTTSGQDSHARQQLTITMPILRLRESSKPQSLTLELGLHLRLENTAIKRVAYDNLLLYAEGFQAQNPLEENSRLYEQLVSRRAQPHLLSEWCGTNGAALLREEIGAGLKYIAGQLALDLE